MSKPSLRERIAKIICQKHGALPEQEPCVVCKQLGIQIEGVAKKYYTQKLEKCGLTDEAIKELCVRYLGWDEPVSDKDLALAKPLFEAHLQKVKEGLK